MKDDKSAITEGFVTPEEFAAAVGVTVEKVRRRIREARLPAVRFGRVVLVPEDALRRILDSQELTK